ALRPQTGWAKEWTRPSRPRARAHRRDRPEHQASCCDRPVAPEAVRCTTSPSDPCKFACRIGFNDHHYLTEQVLRFTSLSWRSVLPAREPVTIAYSEMIARQLTRLREVPGWNPTTL